MGFMNKYNKIQFNLSQFNIAEKIISINVILFILPLLRSFLFTCLMLKELIFIIILN